MLEQKPGNHNISSAGVLPAPYWFPKRILQGCSRLLRAQQGSGEKDSAAEQQHRIIIIQQTPSPYRDPGHTPTL